MARRLDTSGDINDTDGARLKEGYHRDSDGDKVLGYRTRRRPKTPMKYGEMTPRQSQYYGNKALQQDGGKSMDIARLYGLPEAIKAPAPKMLGCGCHEAHLAGATVPIGSHIEADYMCDSGWHNFVVFELIGFDNKGENKVRVDINGDLVEGDPEPEARELEEF